jgi:hypothetical protein
VKGTGAFRERLVEAWVEIRENLGRSSLQAIGVVLGVASVLGGFSISDSQRRRSDERWTKLGGMDRLVVQQATAVKDGTPTALEAANLGLRGEDREEAEFLDARAIEGDDAGESRPRPGPLALCRPGSPGARHRR